MIRHLLIASAATLALALPAAAERGGQGGGKDKGGQSAQVERGGGKQAKAERGGGRPERQQIRGSDRKPDRQQARGNNRGQETRVRIARQDDNRGRDDAGLRVDRGKDKVRVVADGRDRDVIRVRDAARVRDWNDVDLWDKGLRRGFVDGCPPGLAKKSPACIPPGQAKQLVGTVLPSGFRSSVLPLGLRDIWRDDDDYMYRFGDGYLYQVDRDTNLIASLLPLFGGGLGLGQVFPTGYPTNQVPSYYQPFYMDTPDDYYRYSNGYMYEVDRDTGLIENIIPLYDRGYGVGQMLPASYSYYNLPYQYRALYPDGGDYSYRYAPGAIYQVDPTTQLITAVASLLTPGGFGVGQQLPIGYSTYNVPYAYRDRYFDTPDAMYRYGNGYIYRVDPTTQLITAVIDAIV